MQLFYGTRVLICSLFFSLSILAMEEDEALPIVRIWDAEQGMLAIQEALGEDPIHASSSASSEFGSDVLLAIAQEKIEKLQQLFAQSSASSLRFGQRELLFYKEIIQLYEKAKKSEDDFLSTLTEAQKSMISDAKKAYNKLAKRLLVHIKHGNVEKFRHALLSIIAATYRPQDFDALTDTDLEISIAQLVGENNRLVEIQEYLDGFTAYACIGNNPKKTEALIITAAASFALLINTLCYCILHKLSKDDIISSTTVVAIFLVTNMLVAGIVTGFLCIFPLKFICCNKNSAKITTPAIEKMKAIVTDRRESHINLLAFAQRVLHYRQLEEQQKASTSQDELLPMRSTPPIPIPSRKTR